MLVTGIQPTRVCAARESFQPRDLDWLDSCDGHRNEGICLSCQKPFRLKTCCGFTPMHSVQPADPEMRVDNIRVLYQFAGWSFPDDAAAFHDNGMVGEVDGHLDTLFDEKNGHFA